MSDKRPYFSCRDCSDKPCYDCLKKEKDYLKHRIKELEVERNLLRMRVGELEAQLATTKLKLKTCSENCTTHELNEVKALAQLEKQLNRTCTWKRQKLDTDWDEYDSWGTSCGEDYGIVEEWDDTPPKFCNNCGGKVEEQTNEQLP